MKTITFKKIMAAAFTLLAAVAIQFNSLPAFASGGSGGGGSGGGGGGSSAETITVTKCSCNATDTTGGEMLIKAASSNSGARLFAYCPDGSLIGEVQNGGGGRYGGTVMPYQPYDPIYVIIISTTGATITVPTTPFQL